MISRHFPGDARNLQTVTANASVSLSCRWPGALAGGKSIVKARVALVIPFVVSACWNQPVAVIKTFKASRDVSVSVSSSSTSPGDVEIQLATTRYQALGMCPWNETSGVAPDQCQQGMPEYLQAVVVGSGESTVFGFNQPFRPQPGIRFVVVDSASGKVVRQFRLVDKTVNALATGLSAIDRGVMQQELHHLASDQFRGRLAATKDHESAADFIVANLQQLGINPVPGHDYRQAFELSRGPLSGKTTHNIVGLIEGSDPVLKNEYIVVGAHLDHAGTMDLGYTCSFGAGNDPICNGADDNGSGSVTLLNTAKALAAVRGQLKRSVVLMWFSGEEEGLLGSKHWVANPWIPVSKTVYMINIDMVGYLRQNGQKLLALGGGTSKSGQKIIEAAASRYPDVKLTVTDRAGGGSDHVPFMNAGVPGVFFNTGVSSNPNYHKTSDHPDLIDYDGMFSISRIVFETAFEVSRAPTTKAGDFDSGFPAGDYRPSLVTPEELEQTCHHLMQNPFMQ